MRQKPLQWFLSRYLAERHRGTKGLCTSRILNAGTGIASPWRSYGLNEGFRVLGTSKIFNAGTVAPSTCAVRRSYGLDEGFRVCEKVPWDFTTSRAFAAPVVASGNSKATEGANKVDRKINRAIVARMVRLVGDEGHEVLSRYDALNRAQQAGLDLVEVDGRADPPVCKLMDFSKEKFKVKKQEKDLRKKQLERRRLDDLKEVRFSSRTEQKDLEMKAETVNRLLARGHRVKLAVQFHGNDKGDEVGVELLQRAMSLLQAEVKIESGPRVEKMRAWVMIRPILEQKNVKKKGSSKSKHDNADIVDENPNMEVVEGSVV